MTTVRRQLFSPPFVVVSYAFLCCCVVIPLRGDHREGNLLAQSGVVVCVFVLLGNPTIPWRPWVDDCSVRPVLAYASVCLQTVTCVSLGEPSPSSIRRSVHVRTTTRCLQPVCAVFAARTSAPARWLCRFRRENMYLFKLAVLFSLR